MEYNNSLQKSVEARKTLIITTFLLMCLCFFCFKLIPSVFAFEIDYDTSFEELAKGQILNSMDKILLGDLRSSLLHMNIVSKSFNVMQGFAAGLVIVYVYIHIIQECQRSEPSMDFWVRTFVHMTLSILVIIYLGEILIAINLSGSSIINKIQSFARAENVGVLDNVIKVDSLKDVPGAIWNLFKAVSFIGNLLNAINNMVMHLAIAFALIRCYGLFFTTMIEMIIRWIISPIAVADIASHGARSQGVTFMKHYFGCYLQIALFYVVAIACVCIQGWINVTTDLNTAFLTMALYGTMSSIMASCKNLTKQALG